MEQFFTPSQRLQIEPRHGYTEVKLAVSIETFLNHSWDWSDFWSFATGDGGEIRKIIVIMDVAGIIEDTFIWVYDGNTRWDFDELRRLENQRAKFTTQSGETHFLYLAGAGSSASLSAGASSVFWRAVTTSNCVELSLGNTRRGFNHLLSETSLFQFLEASPSLRLLEFVSFAFKEADCRALATLEMTSIEVTFNICSFDVQGAEDTFIEWLRHSQVVTKLSLIAMERSIISSLSGNSSVKSLSICTVDDDKFRSLVLVLPGNQGIESLSVLSLRYKNHEPWCLLLRTLESSP
jgi:hypothetical protein